ncbi:hypothetical protein PsorP6_015945 [Peronosclerospora sorghi]|uniref:Uncharacterized protein n=1 Tax=Peronosclerospora sorghi TaxID=230839 RepID=A0ACC0WMX8_9STRA|nr:hypothetical protein PsorP6_015945 [Peronosclerospora sorghi]
MALPQLQATCHALRREVTACYEQRSRRSEATSTTSLCPRARRWRLVRLLRALKAHVRTTFVAAEAKRARVQAQKDVAEAHQLQLQNLLYEKEHLVRAIRRCRAFRMHALEQLSVQGATIPVVQAHDGVDPRTHAAHLALLTHELDARKQLEMQLAQLKEHKRTVNAQLRAKRAFGRTLPAHVAQIEAATTDLQAYMGSCVTHARARHDAAAAALAPPLYALFCELDAYQAAAAAYETKQDALDVRLVDATGLDATQTVRKRTFPAALTTTPERSASRERESGEIVAVGHEPVRTNERMLPSSSCELWHVHPRALELSLTVAHDDDDVATLVVHFQYFAVAQLVTAHVASAPHLDARLVRVFLYDLFPNDAGTTFPRRDVLYALEDSETHADVTVPDATPCRPYYWANWITGVVHTPRHEAVAPSVRHVMTQLVARFASHLVLTQHLDALRKCKVDVHAHARALFPDIVRTQLVYWHDVAYEDDRTTIEQHFGRTKTSAASVYFRATWAPPSGTHVRTLVEVSSEYPVRAPRFRFEPRSPGRKNRGMDDEPVRLFEDELKQVETEVNAHYNELIPKGTEDWLLLHQVRKLQQCLDVLGRTEDDEQTGRRTRRGKDRRLALVGSEAQHR